MLLSDPLTATIGISFLGSGVEPTRVVVVDQKLKKRSKNMSGEQSDGEGSTAETEVVPGGEDTRESEVELRLPYGAGLTPDRIPKDIPAAMGTTRADTDTRDPGQTRRLEAMGGAKPKRPRFDLPVRETPGSHRLRPNVGTRPGKPGLDRQPLGSGTQPVPNYAHPEKPGTLWFPPDRPTPTYLGPDRPPDSGTQSVNNRFPPELSPRAS